MSPFKWNNYGFELDGPISIPKLLPRRDKLFFMVADEWRNIRQQGQGTATVPSPAIAGGNFSGYVNTSGQPVTIYDPATGDANGLGRTPFANNTIPANRISPVSTALLKYLGTSTQPYLSSSGQVLANYSYATSAPQDRQSLTVRGDFYQSERSQWGFHYSSGAETLLSTGLLGAGSKTVTNDVVDIVGIDRPNATGVSPYLSGSAKTLNVWVNKAAYTPATPGFFGNVSRGSYTGPGFTNLDASLHKVFFMPYSERHQLSIRFEAFNALNHPNWSVPTLNYSSSTFGRITGTANSMRQLQLAAKYQF